MDPEEIRNLPIGARIRGKFGEGTIVLSSRYGKGVRLDDWGYVLPDDIHGFADHSDEVLKELVIEVLKERRR